ncbi:hypothetical protein [Pedobacter sp.]
MLVREQDFSEFQIFLENQRWNNGYEYVAYLDDGFVEDRYEIACFATHQEALAYCQDESTDLDRYEVLSIRSAYRVMSEGPKICRNGAIDVKAMVDAHYEKLQNELITEKKKGVKMETQVFNEDNYSFLNSQLENMGFTDYPQNELIKKMKSNRTEFSISQSFDFSTHLGPNTGKASATLQFSKSEETGMYFFNRYDMAVVRSNEQDLTTQTFYTNNRITVKEAYNLMNGRSVFKKIKNKDGEEREVWLQLDFRNTDKNGNFLLARYGKEYFDLSSQLDKYAFKGLEYAQSKAEFSNKLKKGNRQKATLVFPNGKEKNCFVQANPSARSLVFFDENQTRLRPEKIPMAPQRPETVAEESQQGQTMQQAPGVTPETPAHVGPKIAEAATVQQPESGQLDKGGQSEDLQKTEGLVDGMDKHDKPSFERPEEGKSESAGQAEEKKEDINIFTKRLSEEAEKSGQQKQKAEKTEDQEAGTKKQRPGRRRSMSA